MNYLELLGYAATLVGAIQLVPEVMKALRTHHLKDLSWGMISLMLISSVLWIAYGIAILTIPLVISAGMNMLFEVSLAVLKVKYHKNNAPLFNPATQKQTVSDN